jgi:hypothetical protein
VLVGGTRPACVVCGGWGRKDGRKSGRWSCMWCSQRFWREVCLGMAAGACALDGASEQAFPKGPKEACVVVAALLAWPAHGCVRGAPPAVGEGGWRVKDKDKQRKWGQEREKDKRQAIRTSKQTTSTQSKHSEHASSNRAPVLLRNGSPSTNGYFPSACSGHKCTPKKIVPATVVTCIESPTRGEPGARAPGSWGCPRSF